MENTLAETLSRLTTYDTVTKDYGTTTRLNAALSEYGSPLVPVETDDPVEDLARYVLDTHDGDVYYFMSKDLSYGSRLCKLGLLQFLSDNGTGLAELMTHTMEDIMNQQGLLVVSSYIDGLLLTHGRGFNETFYEKLKALGIQHSLVYYSRCPDAIREVLIEEVTTDMCLSTQALTRVLKPFAYTSLHVSTVLTCIALSKCLKLSTSRTNFEEMFYTICNTYQSVARHLVNTGIANTLLMFLYPVRGVKVEYTKIYRVQITRALIEVEELFDISLAQVAQDDKNTRVSLSLALLFKEDV